MMKLFKSPRKLAAVLLSLLMTGSAVTQDAQGKKSDDKKQSGQAMPAADATQGREKSEAKQPAPEMQKTPAAAKGTQANDTDFVIGEEDVLFIGVWREPEMSRQVVVRPDGKITMPLIGEVEASGLTPLQLKDRLTKQLAAIVNAPEVGSDVPISN